MHIATATTTTAPRSHESGTNLFQHSQMVKLLLRESRPEIVVSFLMVKIERARAFYCRTTSEYRDGTTRNSFLNSVSRARETGNTETDTTFEWRKQNIIPLLGFPLDRRADPLDIPLDRRADPSGFPLDRRADPSGFPLDRRADPSDFPLDRQGGSVRFPARPQGGSVTSWGDVGTFCAL
ncbi:hypothetical protein BV898_08761 [Hypsibius exemplaris]|uniref:Uncharacterized protein n=1 Tax=Hypsibius exemplaris TaxID=2072580 RepID=A0A1W0WPW0_HYPEX|nr:hypothetical protein BV898_08761 [Hypsibius exemplaris]